MPEPAPASPLGALERFLEERIEAGDFPGAVFAIAGREGVLTSGAKGMRAIEPSREQASVDTIYDLASLTKPLATACVAVLLHRDGILDFEEPIGRWLPELRGTGKETLTVSLLATHRAGLPAWLPLYVYGNDIEAYLARIGQAPRDHEPGVNATYSCCGYLLLGEIVSRCGGAPLDVLFRDRVARPAGCRTIGFRPPAERIPRIAPTERDCATERSMVELLGLRYDGWRQGIIRGEVHDGNCWRLGGVAGNAGLFGTAADLVVLGRELLDAGSGLFASDEREIFATAVASRGEARTFGWQSAATEGSAGRGSLSSSSFGHTGFTGSSMWIDAPSQRIYIFLTNRIHPVNKGTNMNAIRREFHRLAVAAA